MTKAQRAAKAKRAGAARRKANACKMFMRKMNPGKKPPTAVRVKRFAGGGISITPIKTNTAKKPKRLVLRRVRGETWGGSGLPMYELLEKYGTRLSRRFTGTRAEMADLKRRMK